VCGEDGETKEKFSSGCEKMKRSMLDFWERQKKIGMCVFCCVEMWRKNDEK
jgi:hypothetical protein